jgi:multiple sugar transport system substrate-binding protein/raffinose/stachyose/melibiose transport system substrate-binding protein
LGSIRIRRCIAGAAAGFAVAAGVAGCSGGSGSTTYKGAPTVTVWSWRSQDAPMWKTVQKDLAAEGTKVNISFRAIAPTSYDAVLQTAMNGGKGPDIFYDRAGEGTLTYAAAGMIQPVDNIANLSSIAKDAVATTNYQGKDYGVPFAVQTMSVFYNKSVLSKAGINSAPTTWSGFLGDLKTLKSKGVTPMYVMGTQGWMLALQMDTVGASTMDGSYISALTAKKASFNAAPYIKTLTAFKQFAPYLESNWQAVGSAGNEQETALALGKCGFVIDGIFDMPQIQQVNPAAQIGQFLVPSPDGGSPKVDWYVDGDISINSKIGNAAENAAAKKVLAFTATKQFGDAFSDIAGEISPIQGVTVPSKYPLSVQAENWYQNQPITPIFGIRSPMDTPPPNAASLKSKSPASTAGIFTSEQNIAVPLLEGKLTPAAAAAKVQQQEEWYFNGTTPAPSPSSSS